MDVEPRSAPPFRRVCGVTMTWDWHRGPCGRSSGDEKGMEEKFGYSKIDPGSINHYNHYDFYRSVPGFLDIYP
jgi:hypothetical protein